MPAEEKKCYSYDEISVLWSVQDAFSKPVDSLASLYAPYPEIEHFHHKFHKDIYIKILRPNQEELSTNRVMRFFKDIFLQKITPEELKDLRALHLAFTHALSLMAKCKDEISEKHLEYINGIFLYHLRSMALVAQVFHSRAATLKIEYENQFVMCAQPVIKIGNANQFYIERKNNCLIDSSRGVELKENIEKKEQHAVKEREEYGQKLEAVLKAADKNALLKKMNAILAAKQSVSAERERSQSFF